MDPECTHPRLRSAHQKFVKELPNLPKVKVKKNSTKEQLEALINLSKKEDIVINPADKGGAVVIMNKNDYIDKCQNLLKDPRHY